MKTARQAEVQRLANEIGVRGAARELGVHQKTIYETLKAANKWDSLDPAVQGAMRQVSTGIVPSGMWVKTKPTEDAPGYSVYLRPEAETASDEDRLTRIREVFEGMEAAPIIAPPETFQGDLLSLYPLFDVHLGMHAWGKETCGPDYDLSLAKSDLARAFGKVLALTPNSETAVLLIGGDFFHADDNRSETPASRHKLDTDGRHDKVLNDGIEILVSVVTALAQKHSRLTIRVLRGNHDEHAHKVLTYALRGEFRKTERITVDTSPHDWFFMQFGRFLLAAHHGDKGDVKTMALKLSDMISFWSECCWRFLYTGHVHKDHVIDLGAIRCESLRAVCPPDSYGARWPSRRALQSITFDKSSGTIMRAIDPIEREAA
jgi:hypothetical protein